jgi:transcriptional regulator with XRE-family HTH domain
MDAGRLSTVFRAVRIRKRWRQIDVALAAGVSQSMVARAEDHRLTSLRLEIILRIAAALDIRVDFSPRWRGGELDRTLNAGHAAMHEQVAATLSVVSGWLFRPEVSFAIYGERGVIDILAFHPGTGALLVIELKTELVDVQALIGAVDRYTRLAQRVAAERGWNARHVGCWVIVSETTRNRRRVANHGTVLRAAFPADGHSMRAWLRNPSHPIRALSFLRWASRGTQPGVRRVRRRVTSAA